MRYVAIFDDDTAMAAVRARLEPAHLAFLEAHRAEIPMAGGLRAEPGGPYAGGLWVFEVASRARAIALTRTSRRMHVPTACSPGARRCRTMR